MTLTQTAAPLLTESEIAQFHKDGFLALNRITSPEEVATIRNTIEPLFASKAGYEEGACFQFTGLENDPDDPGMAQIIWPRHYAQKLPKLKRKALLLASRLQNR